jgi:hypothetical protein
MWWNRHRRVIFRLVNHPPSENPEVARRKRVSMSSLNAQAFPEVYIGWMSGTMWGQL